ncbi:MAG: DUF3050 domain-containing protein [Azospirillaceae bacterium]
MVAQLPESIAHQRDHLINHNVFSAVANAQRLRVFMQAHVFAVWDFMALLKRLQRDMTCCDVMWTPPADRVAARLVNEIVLGEESDEGPDGAPSSHLELYLGAMDEIGAETVPIRRFLSAIAAGEAIDRALSAADAPDHVRGFVSKTIDVAKNGSTEAVLGSFFYGREQLIPDMFAKLLERWAIRPDEVPCLTYYLERHIHLDGDEHGPAAERLIARVLERSPEGTCDLVRASREAVDARIALWDGVLAEFESLRESPTIEPLSVTTT